MKIQFIHPANDIKHKSLQNGYKSFPPPIGLEILANYLISHHKGLCIEIFDGNSTDIDAIHSYINADIVGISDWFSNHNNAIDIAKRIKEINPDTVIVIGGPNASNLGERILLNHQFVDYVVYGDGEEAIEGIVKGLFLDSIPNLWYRPENNRVKFTFKKAFNINSTGPYTLDHLFDFNLKKYNSRLSSYSHDLSLAPMPISSIRGCIKAKKSGPCSFCSINSDAKIEIKTAENFWEQIVFLNSKYGINKFFETGDSFVVGNYPEHLLALKPKYLDIHLRIYANIDTLSHEKINILAKIGVKEIFVGIENIDNEVLSHSNKSNNRIQLAKALQEIEKHGISPFLSFILGLPGETEASLIKNHSFARYLSDRFLQMNHISFNAGVPLIGSTWFNNMLSNPSVRNKYRSFTGKSLQIDDDIDYEALFLLSLKLYTSINFDLLYKVLNTPLHPRLANQVAGFGSIADNIKHSVKHLYLAQELWPKMERPKMQRRNESLVSVG
jgi:anaerobic magnesium-protoporphyrin IX monomethyl ester cyclase